MENNSTICIQGRRNTGVWNTAIALAACAFLFAQSSLIPPHPFHRESSLASLAGMPEKRRGEKPSGMTAGDAVSLALANRLEQRVKAAENMFTSEELIAARRKMLVEINKRYSPQSLAQKEPVSSLRPADWKAEPADSMAENARYNEVAAVWSLLDAAALYLDQPHNGESESDASSLSKRVKQQIMLETMDVYWRASAYETIASEAERIRRDIAAYAKAPREEKVSAEVARIELSLDDNDEPLRQYSRSAAVARRALAEYLDYSGDSLELARFPEHIPDLPSLRRGDPSALQPAALQRRPELRTLKGEGRVDEVQTRKVLLRFVPKATITLSRYGTDPLPEWRNWMTVGTRVAWNVFTSSAYMPDSTMPNPYGNSLRLREYAKGAAIFAQVGLAYVEWKIESEKAASLVRRAEARLRQVEALGSEPGKKPARAEVLHERILLHHERADALLALADARTAAVRLANAVGFEFDDNNQLLWRLDASTPVDLLDYAEEIPFSLLAGNDQPRRPLGDLDIQAMAPSRARQENGRTSVILPNQPASRPAAPAAPAPRSSNRSDRPVFGAGSDQGRSWFGSSRSGRPELPPVASPGDTAGLRSRVTGEDGSITPARLMQADDMRRRVVDKPQEPSRYLAPPPVDSAGIPSVNVTDFVEPQTREIIGTKAWRPVDEPEIRQLADSGLTAPDRSAAATRPHESVSITGVKLLPSPGGSLRPPEPPAARPVAKATATFGATTARPSSSHHWDDETLSALAPLAPLEPIQLAPSVKPAPQVMEKPLDFLPAVADINLRPPGR